LNSLIRATADPAQKENIYNAIFKANTIKSLGVLNSRGASKGLTDTLKHQFCTRQRERQG
jgi:hypothetical protein